MNALRLAAKRADQIPHKALICPRRFSASSMVAAEVKKLGVVGAGQMVREMLLPAIGAVAKREERLD